MLELMKRLAEGDQHAAQDFRRGVEHFRVFFKNNANLSEDKLAEALADTQMPFEQAVGWDRDGNKELLATAALTALYKPGSGFEENEELAQRFTRALKKSMCSIECKYTALDAAKAIYRLD